METIGRICHTERRKSGERVASTNQPWVSGSHDLEIYMQIKNIHPNSFSSSDGSLHTCCLQLLTKTKSSCLPALLHLSHKLWQSRCLGHRNCLPIFLVSLISHDITWECPELQPRHREERHQKEPSWLLSAYLHALPKWNDETRMVGSCGKPEPMQARSTKSTAANWDSWQSKWSFLDKNGL